jgi:leucyl aminopeptidase
MDNGCFNTPFLLQMQIKFSTKVFPEGQSGISARLALSTDCLIIACSQEAANVKERLPADLAKLDRAIDGALSLAIQRGDFDGKLGSTLLLSGQESWAKAGLRANRVLIVGMGESKKAEVNAEKSNQNYAKAAKAALSALVGTSATSALWLVGDFFKSADSHRAELSGFEKIRLTIQLAEEATYSFGLRHKNFKTKPVASIIKLKQFVFATTEKNDRAIREAVRVGSAVAGGVNLAKDLGNLPPNVCNPTYLAKTAQSVGKRLGLKVQVLERKDMERLKMGSFLSVTQGSETPPKFIIMQHNGGTAKEAPIVLVGKGITFDTGGISLKPGEGMDEMKYDMCGAASVLGTMQAVAEMKLRKNVIGVIPTCENMPSGKATRPGDIVHSMSGQTIEILNTDAEGRLILCDALTYVERFKPAAVIDIATLTGACVIALGGVHSGLFSKNEELADKIISAGKSSLDTVWQMPLDDAYQAQLKSNFADIANIGGRPAGSVTAACFLSRFTEKYTWAHLDIAGTAWKSGAAKGSSGRPVPLLTEYLIKA